MPVSVPYVKPWFEFGDGEPKVRCECGAQMFARRGRRIDGDDGAWWWHECESEPTHITQEIEISNRFEDAFTRSG